MIYDNKADEDNCFIFKDGIVNEKFLPDENLFVFFSKLFIPININNNHWVMIEVNFDDCIIYYFDSFKNKTSSTASTYFQTYTTAVLTFLTEAAIYYYMDFNPKNWKRGYGSEKIQQTNAVDCGIFTCANIVFRALNLPTVPINMNYISVFRNKMILSFINNKLYGMATPIREFQCIKLKPQESSSAAGSGALDILKSDIYLVIIKLFATLISRGKIRFVHWLGAGGCAELLNTIAYFQHVMKLRLTAIAIELIADATVVLNAITALKKFPELDLSCMLYGMGVSIYDFQFELNGYQWSEALFYTTACIAPIDYVTILYRALKAGFIYFMIPERWAEGVDEKCLNELWSKKIRCKRYSCKLAGANGGPANAGNVFLLSRLTNTDRSC
jgi:hypothetical protein